MSVADRTREAVEAKLRSLHDEYDGFDVLGETISLPPERYDAERTRLADGGVGGASVWVVDAERLLMTRAVDAPHVWSLPGTEARPEESLEDAALRGVRAHTGVSCALTGVVEVRRVRIVSNGEDAPPLHNVWAYFSAVHEDGDPTPGEALTAVDWRSDAPDVVDTVIEDRVRTASETPRGFESLVS